MEQLDEIYEIVDSMADNIRNGYASLDALDATIPTNKNLEDLDDTVDTIQTKLDSCRDILIQLGAGSPTMEGMDAFEEALEYVQSGIHSAWNIAKTLANESGTGTIEELSLAVAATQTQVMQAWNALEEKGVTKPPTITAVGLSTAIQALETGGSALDLSLGQYGRIIYTATNADGETELVPVKLETVEHFNALANETNSDTAELTVNGHTFQKQQLIEFTSAAMPDVLPDRFLYRCANLSVGNIKVPSNVTAIGNYFMANCWCWNKAVDYSEATNLTTIGTYFCAWQYSLNQPIDLSATSVIELPTRCLQSLIRMNSKITFPESLTAIGDYVLGWSHQISAGVALEIPDSVVSIGDGFLYKSSTYNAQITVGSGVKNIGKWFLSDCVALNTEVIFNCSVQSVGQSFMMNTIRYKQSIILSGDNGTIDDFFLYRTCGGSASTSVQLTGTWTSIGAYFLYEATEYNAPLTINGNQLQIGMFFMARCTSGGNTITITGSTSGTLGSYFLYQSASFGNWEITIADGITAIGDCFMAGCTNFARSIAIPTTVTTIGNYFMQNCTQLTYPPSGMDNVTTIGDYYLCRAGAPDTYLYRDNLQSVQTIGNYFRAYSTIAGIPELPNVTSIGGQFFYGSRVINIEPFSSYNKLTSLGINCFANCPGIQPVVGSLVIPSLLSTLPSGFLYNAYNFSGVVYVGKTTLTDSNPYSFAAFNNSKARLYTEGIVFTGQGGSLAQMSLDNLSGSTYRKTSYVSS